MKIIQQNKKGFSLLVATSLIILISMIAIFILDYMVPFSRNIRGIENASNAYYQANAGIEEALWEVFQSGSLGDVVYMMPIGSINNSYGITVNGGMLPPTGEGNSEFDSDWNIIKQGEPIQLEVGNNAVTNWSNFEFYVRVPNLDGNDSTAESINGSLPIINWQLTSPSNALNASGSYIMPSDINDSNAGGLLAVSFGGKDGIELDDSHQNFATFYGAECGVGKECNLKLSVINALDIGGDKKAPYLEWKIETSDNIQLRYSIVRSAGISYGFKKELKIRVPQTTVNEAFDFTIFQ